jgi:nitrite reductase/ring-hydroxylating ferredoxin subunit
MAWIDVMPMTELEAKGKAVVRRDGRQILLVHNGAEVFACANRCPHEGYPLSEGTLSNGCVLTCNWHNWKFDLATGATLVGGDRLTLYPFRLDAGRIWLDMTPPDPMVRRQVILTSVGQALEDADEQRLVREAARLQRLGVDPVDAIRDAITWLVPRLEFGTTHAIAGAPDWLSLHDGAMARDEKLVALGEILGHIAEDGRGGKTFLFPTGEAAWSEAAFLEAIELEDEPRGIALVRGAIAAGLTIADLLPVFMTATLAHYNDFGHSLIYTVKTGELARRLGPSVASELLLLLTRSLINATREDLLPEFSTYSSRLAAWGEIIEPCLPLAAESLRVGSAKTAMQIVAAWGARHPPERIFPVLVEGAAWLLLHADEKVLTRADGKIADNVGWLDFTHALTFAEAGQTAARLKPELWPAVLLQLACFIGRNSAYADASLDSSAFAVGDVAGFLATSSHALFDHGRDRFIISVHLLKTLLAGKALIAALPDRGPLLAAALNRLLHANMKGRHVLRTARQMLALVEQE